MNFALSSITKVKPTFFSRFTILFIAYANIITRQQPSFVHKNCDTEICYFTLYWLYSQDPEGTLGGRAAHLDIILRVIVYCEEEDIIGK